MKKIFLIFLFYFVFCNFYFVLAADESCKISGKIQQCDDALRKFTNNDGTFITPGASLREIEEFPCLQDTGERRVFQIAMDENFKEIDKEMDDYLTNLTNSKDLYFGPGSQYTYFDGLQHIWKKGDLFKEQYYIACVQSLSDASACIENMAYLNPEDRPSVSVLEGMKYIHGSGGECEKLSDVKVSIFNQVAYNMMLLNKQQVGRDEKKLYDQELRTKYDKITDLFMINLSYIEKIWKGWAQKIKNTYGS